jgi:uncharacterized membrane protein YwaF
MDLRGASAVIAVGVLGMLAMGFAGAAVWWASQRPDVASLLPAQRPFWWSIGLVALILIGVIVYAAFGFSGS